MKKKIVSVFLCGALAMSMLAGCGNSGSNTSESAAATDAAATQAAEATTDGEEGGEAASNGNSYNIAVLAYSMGEEFGVDIVDGAKEKAAEIGNIEIVSPDPAADMQKEIAIFEDLIQQKVDAICVAPIDADAIIPYLDQAREAGIKIVDYDIETDGEVDAKVLADNKEGGSMAADYLVEKMGKTGSVLLVADLPSVTTTYERIEGFTERLAEIAPDVQVIEQLSSGTRDTHRSTVENMLQAYPEITGVFAPDGDRTLGAYTACQANERQDVLIAGYDATGEQKELMIKDGVESNLICSVALYPRRIGATALETAHKLLEGEEISDTVWTELGMLTSENAETFEE